MKTHLKSLFLLIALFGLWSCSHGDPSAPDNSGPEITLGQDRSHLEELRKEIPPETQAENDQLAFMLNLMSKDFRKPPTEVYRRFNDEVRKVRSKFQTKQRKERESFQKEQRKSREKFTKDIGKERETFLAKNKDSDAREEFFDEYEERRQVFFQDQRDASEEFFANAREEQKDFDARLRELQNDFRDKYEDYRFRYEENRKAQKNSQ